MGRIKEWWIEKESNRSKRLAEALGISTYDLEELNYEIEIDSSKEGLIYRYRVEFDDSSSKDILESISRLEDDCRVHLDPWELDDDYDYEEQFNAVIDNKEFLTHFKNEISNLLSLHGLELSDEQLKTTLSRQIFIGVIGSMETFLSDAFINKSLGNVFFFRKFVETHPEFEKRKFELKDIYSESEKIQDTAKKVMLDTNYHNLPSVREMYQKTFQISFPDISEAQKYILLRHDLIHRNGKTKDGNVISISDEVIHDLIECIDSLVNDISDKLIKAEDPF